KAPFPRRQAQAARSTPSRTACPAPLPIGTLVANLTAWGAESIGHPTSQQCYNRAMRILYLDPLHGGSHAAVANGYAQHSRHQIDLLTLPIAGGWRWRMRGAAVTFARMLRERATTPYDLIITTDMLDLATFLGLSRDITANTPTVV